MLLGCCHCGDSPSESTPPSESRDVTNECAICGVAPARFQVTMTMPEIAGNCAAGCTAYKTTTTLRYVGDCTWESDERAMAFSRTIFGDIVCCDITNAGIDAMFQLRITAPNSYSLRMSFYRVSSGANITRWFMAGTFIDGDCFTSRTLPYSSLTSTSTTLSPAAPCDSGNGSPQSPCGIAGPSGGIPTAGTVSAFIQIG